MFYRRVSARSLAASARAVWAERLFPLRLSPDLKRSF